MLVVVIGSRSSDGFGRLAVGLFGGVVRFVAEVDDVGVVVDVDPAPRGHRVLGGTEHAHDLAAAPAVDPRGDTGANGLDEAAELEPSSMLLVDDNVANLEAAAALGMTTVAVGDDATPAIEAVKAALSGSDGD